MFGLTITELSSIVGMVGGLLGGGIAFYMLAANKRKVNSESLSNTSEAYEKMVNTYEKRIDKLLKRMDSLEERIVKLEEELEKEYWVIDALRAQLKKLKVTPEA